jgi:hypothetical protein
MNSLLRPLSSSLGIFTLVVQLFSSVQAQEANVLGLPAIPQPKPGAAASTGAANTGTAAKAAPASTPGNRDALAGEVGIQHSAREGIGRVIITTRATFTTAGVQSNALDAARLVQNELGKSCGKQCKPIKMTAPKILASGQLEFELAFTPLHLHLTQPQFLALLQSKPLNLTPEQLKAPAATPAVAVQIGPTSQQPPATPTGNQ